MRPPAPAESRAPGGATAPQRVAPGVAIPGDVVASSSTRPVSTTVLREAIASSQTLAAADATLAEAREAIVEARRRLYPRLDLGAGAGRSRRRRRRRRRREPLSRWARP